MQTLSAVENFKESAKSFVAISNNLGSKNAGEIAQNFVDATIALLTTEPKGFKQWASLGIAVGTITTKISPEAGDEAFNNVISTKAFAGALGYLKPVFCQKVLASCASNSSTYQLAYQELTHL